MKRLPYFLLIVFFIGFGLFYPSIGFAEVDDPGCDPFDPLCPIDGGLSFLIAAGVGLAARKAYKTSRSHLPKKI